MNTDGSRDGRITEDLMPVNYRSETFNFSQFAIINSGITSLTPMGNCYVLVVH